MNVPISENKTAEVRQPDSNESKTEKISAPLTTLSSHSDPYPHYFMTFAMASFGLLATSGPQARATKDVYHVALASLGAISAVSNSLKVYQLRTGKPKDLDNRRFSRFVDDIVGGEIDDGLDCGSGMDFVEYIITSSKNSSLLSLLIIINLQIISKMTKSKTTNTTIKPKAASKTKTNSDNTTSKPRHKRKNKNSDSTTITATTANDHNVTSSNESDNNYKLSEESNITCNSVEMMESSLNYDCDGNIIASSLDVDNNDEDGERVVIVTTEKGKKTWRKRLLESIIDSYLKNVNWDDVADQVKEKTARMCYDQWKKVLVPSIKKYVEEKEKVTTEQQQ
ncbi:6681_t:CDS:2 [Entrophospora sp. SA101]|nr:6681_t:CDS:2 [Entrophospora sp. SA101]